MDDAYGCVVSIRTFGSMLEDDYLAKIIDLPMPLSVTLHIAPIAQSEAIALVKRQIDWMDKEIIDEQMSAVKKGYDYTILPPELRYSKEEAEELLDFLRNKNERLFDVHRPHLHLRRLLSRHLSARSTRSCPSRQGNSLGIEPLYYRQRQALNSVLPLGMNHIDVTRYLTTGQIAMQMPFASLELNQEGGGYYGQSKQSGNLVICKQEALASPMGFVCGKPGSGQVLLRETRDHQYSARLSGGRDHHLRPRRRVRKPHRGLGGVNVRLAPDSDTALNPFDLSDVEGRADAAQLAFKIDAFLALSAR